MTEDERLRRLEIAFDKFRMVSHGGVTTHGTLGTGYAVHAPCGEGGAAEGAGFPVPPPPPPTPMGACCADDGTCTITTEAGCAGAYQGDDTVCDPNPCPAPGTGACCLGNDCSIQAEVDCLGFYQGDGTTCDPNPCLGGGGCCMFYPGGEGLGDLSCGARFWHQSSCGFINPDDGLAYRVYDNGAYSDVLDFDSCSDCFGQVTIIDVNTGGTYHFYCGGSCDCDICTGPGSEISISYGEYS